jgi:hypothetical protein
MSAPQPPFAEEFPHLTSVGKGLARFILGVCAALAVTALCAVVGIGAFLSGWFACMAFNLVREWGQQ